MCIFIDFWKLKTENSILHVFSFLYKLSFKNSFCFLSILSCQTSFLVSKIENCFWKQKIREKTVTKYTLNFATASSHVPQNDLGLFSFGWRIYGSFMNSKIVLANLWLSVEGKNVEKKNWKKGLGFYLFIYFYKKGIGSELMKMFVVLTYITKIIKFICFKCQ